MDRAVDRDGGFFFEMLAEAGVEAVHFLDDAAQVLRLDREFAHAAGVAAAEPGGEDEPARPSLSVLTHQALRAWSPLSRGAGEGLDAAIASPSPALRERCRAQRGG